MARTATGEVIVRHRKRGVVYALRFRASGRRHYVTLGTRADGWTQQRAEIELQNVLADVRRGIWRPIEVGPTPDEPRSEPTFHAFASEWFASREIEGLKPRTLEYLRWALCDHLLPHFAGYRLADISTEEIDRYVRAKALEGRLSNGSVNKVLEVMSSVMELAVEYGHAPRNPAKGRRRRLPTTTPARPYLEPAQVTALLVAAGELDSEDRTGRRYRRPLIATLAFAGPRIGELLALTWADVDLADGRLRIRESKTAAGVRAVDIQPELHDELVSLKLRAQFGAPGDLVFPTRTGKADNRNNIRRRVLKRAVFRANARIAEDHNVEPLPEQLSPHALRRTFASWLVAEGEDPAYVMQQLGHTDPKMTLGLYARALRSKRRRSQRSPGSAGIHQTRDGLRPGERPASPHAERLDPGIPTGPDRFRPEDLGRGGSR